MTTRKAQLEMTADGSQARADPALTSHAHHDHEAMPSRFPAKPIVSLHPSMRVGRCYPLAYTIAADQAQECGWSLVHGAVLGDGRWFGDGLWWGHCWVQTTFDGQVFVFDPVADIFCREADYFPGSTFRKIVVYSTEMARRLRLASGHMGPWFPYWHFSLGVVDYGKLAFDWKAQHIALAHYLQMVDRGMLPDLASQEWEKAPS